VADRRLEVTSSRDEVLEGHRLVCNRLVNDRCFVSFLMNGDDSVGLVVLMGIPLDDGLNQMMNVMRSVGVNLLSLVDDDLLGRSLGTGVLGSVQRSEHSLVLIGSNVTFFDVGYRNDLLVMLFLLVLSVQNGLSVVLDVVDVSVNLALTLDLLNFMSLMSLMGNGSQVLVIVSSFLSISLVQKTILLRLRVMMLRRVSVFLELLSYRLVFTVSSVVGRKSRGRTSSGSSGSRGRNSSGGRSSGRSSSVGTGRVTRVFVSGRVVREDLLDLVHCDRVFVCWVE